MEVSNGTDFVQTLSNELQQANPGEGYTVRPEGSTDQLYCVI